jgi:hypothetical protein
MCHVQDLADFLKIIIFDRVDAEPLPAYGTPCIITVAGYSYSAEPSAPGETAVLSALRAPVETTRRLLVHDCELPSILLCSTLTSSIAP